MNARKARLVCFFGVIAVVSALAQPTSQLPASTNVPEPSPTSLLTPETVSSSPTSAPMLSPTPQSDAAPGWHDAPSSAGDAHARS